MERSDDFRVIRDYASDYANAQQYNYNVVNPQPLSGQMTTPWHKNVDRLGEHAFRNPYEDFGAALTSSPYAAAAVPRSTANTGARIGEDGRNREVRFFAGGRTGRGGGKFQQQQRGQQQMPQRKGAIRRQHTQYPVS
jgi:hypothetical protein